MKYAKLIIVLFVVFILIGQSQVLSVSDSYVTTIKANNTEVKRGNTIIISIGLDKISIQSGEKGIGSYTACINYDTSIFEYVSTNGTEKWDAPFWQNGLITATTKDGNVVNSTQVIGTITFKVKQNAKLGETEIKLTNFLGSIGEIPDAVTQNSDLLADDKTIKVKVINDKTEIQDDKPIVPNKPETENNNKPMIPDNETSKVPQNNTEINNKNELQQENIINKPNKNQLDNTISNKPIPQTGKNNIYIWSICIIAFSIGIISFIKLIRLHKKY